jgi:DNA-3-methyladenine glycosylase II
VSGHTNCHCEWVAAKIAGYKPLAVLDSAANLHEITIQESDVASDQGVGRIITGDACVAEGAAWLAANEPRFAAALKLTGPLPLRRKLDGFAELLSAIVSQQVSVASARAIWGRMKHAGLTDPGKVMDTTDEDLRAIGLSRQKVKYARALADADIDFNALRTVANDDVINTLVQVRGVGAWTAEIYAMFSLGRADVFAPGDLALQEAAHLLFELPGRPKERALRKMAEDWSPWRSVAARLLFSYYHVAKSREGI